MIGAVTSVEAVLFGNMVEALSMRGGVEAITTEATKLSWSMYLTMSMLFVWQWGRSFGNG